MNADNAKKDIWTFWHKLFATHPNEGMHPKEAIGYSITGFGQNMICTIIGSYLTVFMTDAIGVSALWVAFLMLFARIYDALNDPIMGSIVDRTRTKWGKCRPYLKWMAIPIAICTILCFLPIYPNNAGGFAAICVVYVIWGMVYTVSDVPYWGLSAAMTADTNQRGNLLTVARIACTLGAGLVTMVIPLITSAVQKPYQDPSTGLIRLEHVEAVKHLLANTYFFAAIVIVVLAVPTFFVGYKFTVERYTAQGAPPSLKHNLSLLFKNKPLLLIVLSGILGSARMVYMYTGGLYFAKYALANVNFLGMHGEGLYTLITLAVIPGGLAASVMVPWFTKKLGKKNTFIFSHLLGAAAMFAMFFAGYNTTAGLIVALVGLVIIGIPQGFSNIITYALIGDTVDYLEWKTGERGEGICFSMQTLINKIGMAVGAFVGVLAYFMSGISPNNPEGSLTPQGINTLWLMLVLVGALSMLLCAVPMFFFKFDEKAQRIAVEETARRKIEAENK